MPNYIEIEGGLARVVERNVLYESTLEALMPHMERRMPVATPILPRSTVASYWNESNPGEKELRVIMESEPRVRIINYQGREYRLAIPWTYFVFFAKTRADRNDTNDWSLEDYRVFARPDRISNWDDLLWRAPLPNLFGDNRICFGATAPNANQTIANRLDHIVNEFWVTPFNNDLGTNLPHDYENFRAWQTATRRDDRCFTSWAHFDPTNYSGTVRDILYVTEDLYRNVPVTLPNSIPEIPLRPTFGRAEEWLRGLTDVQRGRLSRALDVLRSEEPAIFVEPEAIEDEDEDDE